MAVSAGAVSLTAVAPGDTVGWMPADGEVDAARSVAGTAVAAGRAVGASVTGDCDGASFPEQPTIKARIATTIDPHTFFRKCLEVAFMIYIVTAAADGVRHLDRLRLKFFGKSELTE